MYISKWPYKYTGLAFVLHESCRLNKPILAAYSPRCSARVYHFMWHVHKVTNS